MDPTITGAIIGAMISIIAAFIAAMASAFRREGRNAYKEKIEKEQVQISASLGPVKVARTIEGQLFSSPDLLKRMEQQVVARIAADTALSRDEIRTQVENEIHDVRERIQKIEDRFPEQTGFFDESQVALFHGPNPLP